MSIYVAKRKNDQYREGHTSYLARSRKSSCPELLRFCRSLIHRIRLFVVLLGLNLARISTLARACQFLLLERNLKSTSSPLLTTFQSTARIVWGLVQRRTPLVGAYRAIYWICMLGGGVLPRRTDTLNMQLKIVWALQNRFCSEGILNASLQFIVICFC